MPTHTQLQNIVLPTGLIWENEFDWSPIKQTVKRGTTGVQFFHTGVKISGQPILLTGNKESAWIRRDTLVLLYALLDLNTTMTLVLEDLRVFNVKFDHSKKPIDAEGVIDYTVPTPDKPYHFTLNLITV